MRNAISLDANLDADIAADEWELRSVFTVLFYFAHSKRARVYWWSEIKSDGPSLLLSRGNSISIDTTHTDPKVRGAY